MARMTEQELEARITELGATIEDEVQAPYRYEIRLRLNEDWVTTCAGTRRIDALYSAVTFAKQASQGNT